MRTDLLPSNMTAAKEAQVRAVLAAYRRGAVMLASEQWRLFFETGRFNKNHDKDKTTFAAVIGAANRVQMCRYQVVGQLDSWLSNRANDFRDVVTRSTLDPDTKHMLHLINRLGAWFSRHEIAMKETGEIVPGAIRHLARSIMRHVMRKHRRPDMRRISMRLDQRAACLEDPIKASQNERIGWWINMSTMTKGRKIAVPLLTYDRHEQRGGRLCNGVLVTEDRESSALSFGVVSDIGEDCEASRNAYQPEREVMALDFGLSTLFATDDGALLGKGWLDALHGYDQRITRIARGQQRHGRKPRDSARYRKAVASLRGWIRTEVGRVLNALVAAKRPAALVLERLNFQNPTLSRRLNRIIQNCGRSVIKAKLADFHDRFGITSQEVNPAYTSQTCSCCGYVDKRNRRSQSTFRCLWCGSTLHADVNAARNIGQRRALSIGSVFQSKASVLTELVRQLGERRVHSTRSGGKGSTADPRLSNPYFGGGKPISVRMSGQTTAPDMVLAMST
ncbi:RNA-guided endonuclease InsQ/TnpB family protein [Acidocella aminolytica]|uniref:RNA-guided endonuclease InsQ/TnpB family protein n=2 Tax=Acidocella aminolytica TaxID=33998 RepID=UPI000932D42E|nr:zinc ribbon domain-containing protein [Acidocella aminolytica]